MTTPTKRDAVDTRLTLVSVLQELTVAAMDLFDPARPMNEFLDRLAARLGGSVALVIEGCSGDGVVRLLGSAGLSRASRELPLVCHHPGSAGADVASGSLDTPDWDGLKLPYAELTDDHHRWLVPLSNTDTPLGNDPSDAGPVHAALMIFFEHEPELPRQYRGMVERLGATLRSALSHRRLYARSLETARQMEEQGELLRRLNVELERRVATRTRDLASANADLEESLASLNRTQDQLLHAGKMAAVGTLVAGLSHELNNPVCVILAYAQTLLERTPSRDPSRRALLAIERQASRCGELLRALLDFSRKETTAREVVRPAAILERVQSLTQGSAERQGLTLTVEEPDSELPSIQVCKTEIESALLNLMNNALDATPKGGTITLSAFAAVERGEPGIAIEVADSGPGIDAEIHDRIFDPFFTTKPVGQGTGLGLSIARQILETHGGSIRAARREGGGPGSVLRVWLPMTASVTSTTSLEAHARSYPSEAAPTARAQPAVAER